MCVCVFVCLCAVCVKGIDMHWTNGTGVCVY